MNLRFDQPTGQTLRESRLGGLPKFSLLSIDPCPRSAPADPTPREGAKGSKTKTFFASSAALREIEPPGFRV